MEELPSTKRGRIAGGWGRVQFWMLVLSSKMPLLKNLQMHSFVYLCFIGLFILSFIHQFFFPFVSALTCSFIYP